MAVLQILLQKIGLAFVAILLCWIILLYIEAKGLQAITIYRQKTSVLNVNYRTEKIEIKYVTKVNFSSQLAKKRKFIKERKKIINEPFGPVNQSDDAIAVLVFSCNRISIARCLNKLLKFRPSVHQFPVIVSQDCEHKETIKLIKSYGRCIYYMKRPKSIEDIYAYSNKGYYKIARHYAWALNKIFFDFNFNYAIILEDDLEISCDFFEYFLGTLPILKADPTLWCISAWNDNGKLSLTQRAPELLHRTDFFPGLGWLLRKSTWSELTVKWPKSYWDDWMRKPEQRKGRACIRPEIPRTTTFGKKGVSEGQFYEEHLKYLNLNRKFVPFTRLNLTYLLKENYDKLFLKSVYESRIVSSKKLVRGQRIGNGSLQLRYKNIAEFKSIARKFGLMSDTKSGVPRTAYKGVVSFSYNNQRIYLAPNPNWKNYDNGPEIK